MAAKKKSKPALKRKAAVKKRPAAKRKPVAAKKKPVAARKRKVAKKKPSRKPVSRRKQLVKAKPAGKRKVAAKPQRKPSTKPAIVERFEAVREPAPLAAPMPEDTIEVSGIYGRVVVSESDPYGEVREVFDHFDRDKSGSIERPEFARICEALGVEAEEEELEAGFASVDTDANGRISWDEFLGWWQAGGR